MTSQTSHTASSIAELIARLRTRKEFGRDRYDDSRWVTVSPSDPDCKEAADVIELLMQERDGRPLG
jgi:hypothetical protein